MAVASRAVAGPLAADGPTARNVLPGPFAWDDPCHLCHAQGVRAEPRAVLARIEGLEQVELEGSESCCGSAGIYSLLRPDDSRAVFEPKRAALERSGARVLVVGTAPGFAPAVDLAWPAGVPGSEAGGSVDETT